MRRWQELAAVVVGLAATAGAVVLAIGRVEPAPPDADPGGAVWLVGLAGLAAAAWLASDRARSQSTDDPLPWSDAGPIVDEPPEATPQTHPLSGGDLAAALARAGEAARERRQIEDGMAVVRPLLREAYLEAMVAGGQDRQAAEADLDDGSWTADRAAASALSPAVEPPSRSLRRRLADWLYPGRAVLRRTVRGVDALTAAADESLSPVAGSDAPRQVPTYEPSLAVREVGADGRVREPRSPPAAEEEPGDGDDLTDRTDGTDRPDRAGAEEVQSS